LNKIEHLFGFLVLFFLKRRKKVILDGKKVVLDGKKVFCLQNKPCRHFGRQPATVKHSKEHKKLPKIGEFLALKVVCTAQRRIGATKFDFVKYIIVKLIKNS
jgi:hypothetical protein